MSPAAAPVSATSTWVTRVEGSTTNFSLPQVAPQTLYHRSGTAPGQGTHLGLYGPGTINRGKNLVLFWETELFQLREDQGAVYLHFKGTAAALDEPGSQSVLILDGVLQTCSVWEIVSLRAVFD